VGVFVFNEAGSFPRHPPSPTKLNFDGT